MSNLASVINKLIWLALLTLALVTPLLFSTYNTEIFEVPKMLFVYIVAVVILFLTLFKFVIDGKLVILKNPVLITFLVFLIVQAISTFFSIDKFTSVYGYPSRLNGGLLSNFAYFVILACALINLNAQMAKKLILALVAGAVAVSLWGIPSHFGRDPSCLVMTGRLTSDCWQREFDPTLRIFSTFGQPNWLASYLVLIIPFSIVLYLMAKNPKHKILFLSVSSVLFMALILTNSRAGFLGLLVGFALMGVLFGNKFIRNNLKSLALISAAFFLISVLFGTTVISRINDALTLSKKTGAVGLEQIKTKTTSPTLGGTESGQIRFIVWKGAIDAFSARPVLGWGPETFAYSYYLFRPNEHNQTSEWNFFYNKAHNEFLNYLANTGLLGFFAYILFLVSVIRTIRKTSGKLGDDIAFFQGSAIASIVGYQVAIFFGFSTVASQVAMFLIIASLIVLGKGQNLRQVGNDKIFLGFKPLILTALVIVFLISFSFPLRLAFADFLARRAENFESTNTGRAVNLQISAISVFPVTNPFYLADLSYILGLYASEVDDPERIDEITTKTDGSAQKALGVSPNNLIITRKVANAYFFVSEFDEKYYFSTIETLDRMAALAPNEPSTHLAIAKIESGLDLEKEALETVDFVLSLKPDYIEARELRDQLTFGLDGQ